MPFTELNGIPIWGKPQDNAVKQILNCQKTADYCALMADHHLGYAVPIGGVVAYEDLVSPSGVGFDIACGNKAVLLDIDVAEVRAKIDRIMDDIFREISFGVGMKNKEEVEHELFEDDPAWDIQAVGQLKNLARSQLGTVGSGNHYVDLFVDESDRVWCGVHFGSRGLGHKIATHFLRIAGGREGMHVDPALLSVDSQEGQEYLAAMELAGRYAYAGRDWVCSKVASLLGAHILEEIHNNHNFAWREKHNGKNLWVVRKGATPAFPGQKGFIGGSMGDISVIVKGVESEESKKALYSTVHGAGRVMSRRQATGRSRWKRGKRIKTSGGAVSSEMMMEWVNKAGVVLRGAGTDESPHCYKRLPEVLEFHEPTIEVLHTFHPIGVAMAGAHEFDPYRD
jgi:tRNA-splicing ligase RtcB